MIEHGLAGCKLQPSTGDLERLAVSSRRIGYLLAGLATAAIMFVAWHNWPRPKVYGDGVFADSGMFSGARYHLRFSQVPLSKAGKYEYHFGGLPKEEYGLVFPVNFQSVGNDAKLPSFQEYLDVVLTDSHGKEMCSARGILATNQDGQAWTLSSDPVQPAFWNSNCLAIHVEPVESYTLTIQVSQPDSRSVGVFVTPVLNGGGIELP